MFRCFSTKACSTPSVSCWPRSPGGDRLHQRVKKRKDVELWEVTRKNRDDLPGKILPWLEARLGR